MNLVSREAFLAIVTSGTLLALSQSLSAQTTYLPLGPRAQAMMQACQSQFEDYWSAWDKAQSLQPPSYRRSKSQVTEDQFRGFERLVECNSEPDRSSHYERELQRNRDRRAQLLASRRSNEEANIAETYKGEAWLHLDACRNR